MANDIPYLSAIDRGARVASGSLCTSAKTFPMSLFCSEAISFNIRQHDVRTKSTEKSATERGN